MPASSCKLRTGRSSEQGSYYLLTSCCRNRVAFFSNPDSASIVLTCARWLDQHQAIDLKAVVVMPDHVHMVLGLGEFSLSQVMHRFKSYTSHAIAKAARTDGGIWQAGYHDRGIRDESALRAQVEYCLLNPVRAGLVVDFHDYPYWWCCWEV
jgi:REP element-mobilizing transposase RayT